MQFFTLATLLAAGSATVLANPLEKRVNQKANEYASPICDPPLNFGYVNIDPPYPPLKAPPSTQASPTRLTPHAPQRAVLLTSRHQTSRHDSVLGLGNVNMDPSSHSVYLAGATWRGWSGPNLSGDGGSACSGTNLGTLGQECQNLDTALPGGRIACLTPF